VTTNDFGGGMAPLPFEAGLRYEVAEDLFGDLIGWCSAQAAEEEKKPKPDPAVVKRWVDQAAQYSAERQALHAHDVEAVEAAIAKYGPIVRDLYPGRRTSGR
jgi:hypothetical protein